MILASTIPEPCHACLTLDRILSLRLHSLCWFLHTEEPQVLVPEVVVPAEENGIGSERGLSPHENVVALTQLGTAEKRPCSWNSFLADW
jgi:hypothetical protein